MKKDLKGKKAIMVGDVSVKGSNIHGEDIARDEINALKLEESFCAVLNIGWKRLYKMLEDGVQKAGYVFSWT